MELANYIPEDVTITVAGLVTLEGLVDGTFVRVTKDVIPFAARRTTDGTVSRLYNRDATYTVEITLYSGSDSNDIMTKLWQLDEISQMGKFPLMIKDRSGTSLFFSATSWIQDIPPLVLSSGFEQRTWVIRSSQGAINIGGNTERGDALDSIISIATSALPSLQGLI